MQRKPWLERETPNILTCLRILLALIFPFAAPHYRVAIVALALVTEYLDGALSRALGVTSQLGQLLDPIADKMFFAAVVYVFIRDGSLTVTDFVFLGLRDICVLGAVIWTLARRRYALMKTMKPLFAGKALTAFQYLVCFDILLFGRLNGALFYTTSALSLVAAAQYADAFRKMWRSPA